MAKAFGQFAVLVVLFFSTWFALAKIDFVGDLHVEQITKDNERKLAAFMLEAVDRSHEEVQSDTLVASLNSIKRRLCEASGVPDSSIHIHIFKVDDVNAFALPDGHIIVYSGLIKYCETPEELAGAMAHEIGHIENHHVMKKLVKEVGLSMLTTIAGGESGGQFAREMVKLLSSTAFDREQETEADTYAVNMLAKADIDPDQLANFFFRLSHEKFDVPKSVEWVSTHPNSAERSEEILKMRKTMVIHTKPVMSGEEWKAVRGMVSRDKGD